MSYTQTTWVMHNKGMEKLQGQKFNNIPQYGFNVQRTRKGWTEKDSWPINLPTFRACTKVHNVAHSPCIGSRYHVSLYVDSIHGVGFQIPHDMIHLCVVLPVGGVDILSLPSVPNATGMDFQKNKKHCSSGRILTVIRSVTCTSHG